MSRAEPSIAVFYHFFPPDEIQSAIHYGDLALGLAARGWQVSVHPSTWSSDDKSVRFLLSEEWRGVSIRRIWRPNLAQASDVGRLLNAAWMVFRWSFLALTLKPRPDILIIGTDPILSLSAARVWKLLSPKTHVVHWCFDVYPEAAIADGVLPKQGLLTHLFTSLMGSAYRSCALIADLGPCMRAILLKYPSAARRETIVPWAFEEPEAPLPIATSERLAVFGETPLALLYSGSFGRAHSYQELLDLAEFLKPSGAKLVFSVRGKRQQELKEAVLERNLGIGFVPFAPADKLQDRLACADVHVVTLRTDWTGMVVPSKFFGALAAGRPVLFVGSPDSSLAQWILEFDIGWVLTGENQPQVAQQLLTYVSSRDEIREMQQRCFLVHRKFFSKASQIEKFDQAFRSLMGDQTKGACPNCG